MISEVHNRTMSPAVEVSSLRSVRPSFLFLSGILVVGLLDIKVSRLEQEDEALLWAKCIQLLWTLVISTCFLSQQVFLPFMLSCLSFWAVIQADKFCGKMMCTFDLCFTKMQSGMSKTLFFLLRGSFIFQTEAWGQLSYGIKNVAMDIKISCGIRVPTGLAGCFILKNKIVSLLLT